MQPPKAWLAADGIVENVDTLKKTMQMSVKQIVFHDKDYKLSSPVSINMDMKVALVYKDSIAIPLTNVHKGDEGTAVSYAEALKKIEPTSSDNGTTIIKKFPSFTPIDEVYLKRKDIAPPKEKQEVAAKPKPVSVKYMLGIAVGIICALILFLLLTPGIILRYFIVRYNRAKPDGDKPYWAYRAATYYLHMTGIFRGNRTPMQYARETVDPQLGTSFVGFMNVYLKKKYAKQALNISEQQYVSGFLRPFLQTAREKIKFGRRFFGFLNPLRSIGFFMMPEEDEKEM